MTALALDTHAIVRRLTASGLSEDQAEAITTVIRDNRDADLAALATKADILVVKADIKEVELHFAAGLSEAKSEIIKWVLSAIGFQAIVIVGAIVALSRATH